jgi:hypothetical protein
MKDVSRAQAGGKKKVPTGEKFAYLPTAAGRRAASARKKPANLADLFISILAES